MALSNAERQRRYDAQRKAYIASLEDQLERELERHVKLLDAVNAATDQLNRLAQALDGRK